MKRLIVSLAVLCLFGPATALAQYDASAELCEFDASVSWYQAFEASAPVQWGQLIIRWDPREDLIPGRNNVKVWRWYNSAGTLYSMLDGVTATPAQNMERDISVSAAWRLAIKVDPYPGNAITAELHPIGGIEGSTWVFGGLLMQTGSRPLTAHGTVTCGDASSFPNL